MNEAKHRANARYDKDNYDRLEVTVRKDAEINADVIRRYAESKGVSVNALLLRALEQRICDDADFEI